MESGGRLCEVTNCFPTVHLEGMDWDRYLPNISTLPKGLPGGPDGNASAYNAGDLGSLPGSGRSSGEGNGNPLQYSCLENPMDGGAR